MTNFKINPLFSVPLYQTELQRNLTEEEINSVKENSDNTYGNKGKNFTSQCTNVLDDSRLKNLKFFFEEHLNNYFKEVVSIEDGLKPYITQSWLNYNNKDQGHHIHIHQNSIVSGVFYVSSDKKNDAINFKTTTRRDTSGMIYFGKPKKYNTYNSYKCTFPVNKGMLIIFPSNLKHYVEINEQNYTRVSLGFNVFVKGIAGYEKSINKLILS